MTDSGGATYYGYDMGDRLTSITRSGLTTNTFSYNGFDTRVSKTDSTGTTSYKRAGAGVTSSLLKSTISGTTTDYTPGISSRVSSTSTFMHSGLKNSDEQSGSGGTIAASLQYDAFGKQVSSSGTWVGAFKYGGAYGYQTDPDHGLKLVGHRYYEADTGRFLTRDPIKDGRNWYGYCGNGPVSYADPLGTYIVYIGFSESEEAVIDNAIFLISETFHGGPIGDEVYYGDKPYFIKKGTATSPLFGSSYDDESNLVTLYLRDAERCYPGKVFSVGPDGAIPAVLYYKRGLLRLLAHELAHIVVAGDSDDEQSVVDGFENPIMEELGDPIYMRRGHYNWPSVGGGRR